MLIGTIDLYHVIPLSVTLTVAGVSPKQSPLASFLFWGVEEWGGGGGGVGHTLELIKMKFMWW